MYTTFSQIWYWLLIGCIGSYFIGCFNFAVLISRLKHRDIRSEGSGNPGTMNMSRTFGLKIGLINFLCDALKGVIPVMVGHLAFSGMFFSETTPFMVSDFARYLFGLFAVIGHIFPVTMKFRGGKGIAGLHTSEDDFVQEFLTTTNHQYLLLFTNKGRMHQLKVHQVPEGSRTAKGMHIANLLPLEKDEWVANALTVREFAEESYFLFTTKQGMVKRSSASLYARCRKSGMIALGLKEGDELIAVREVTDSDHVVLATAHGMAIRFAMPDVRPMGRSASGVKGIGLRRGDEVVACVTVKDGDNSTMIMTVSALGYGKRTKIDLYRMQSRGGIGLINFKVSPKTGSVIGAMPVSDTDSLILLTSTNKIIRLSVEEVRSVGRATMGVRLVRLDDGASVVGFDTVADNGDNAEE